MNQCGEPEKAVELALARFNKSSSDNLPDVAMSITQLLHETKRYHELIAFVGPLIGAPKAHIDDANEHMHAKEDRITVLVRESQQRHVDIPPSLASSAAAASTTTTTLSRMNRNASHNSLSSVPSAQQTDNNNDNDNTHKNNSSSSSQSKRPRQTTIGDDESELFGDRTSIDTCRIIKLILYTARFDSARSSVASTPVKIVRCAVFLFR